MDNYSPHKGGQKGLPQRKSIRLKGYDYAQEGLYFITICCEDRLCLFGEIINGERILNEKGTMIDKWWQKIPEKFPDIALGEYVVMPNHIHAIVINTGMPVGTDPRVCPEYREYPQHLDGNGDFKNNEINDNGQTHGFAPMLGEHNLDEHNLDEQIMGEHLGSPLHGIVQWFKTMTTNEYIHGVKTLEWKRFEGKIWQRNYYEHIIRNQQSYETISNYIINNPAKWDNDKLNRE